MNNQLHYWWYVYGYFTPGVNNLPCTGEVISYYIALSDLSKEKLAGLLNCTERYIEMLKSPNNKDMPKLLPRRILLAKTLHIPPILLGLSSVTLLEWGEGSLAEVQAIGQDTVANTETMTFYERLLALSWELYYTSSVQKATDSIDDAFQRLNTDFKGATGVKKDQHDAMCCRFYQLYSLISRDRMDFDKAIDYQNQAVAIAVRLKNAELIASSLLRRARAYHHRPERELALQDALNALPYADLSRPPLKGKCYQMAGESQAYLAGNNTTLQEKSLDYFNTAAKIARKGNMEPDGSFVKTDITSIYIERAKALTLFGRFDEAHDAFEIARKNLSPELTRWQVNLLIEEAKTYLAEGDISSCCYSLFDALPIVRAINLPSKEASIYDLYVSCKDRAPSSSGVKKLEKMVMAKAS
jgi:tetratricopeptide (TPR) repeat protein